MHASRDVGFTQNTHISLHLLEFCAIILRTRKPKQSEVFMKSRQFSGWQMGFLVALRLVIGWHFLYEGLVKLLQPEWTAAQYLQVSSWIFAPFFHWIADTPAVLAVIDFLNIWGLILIGLGLMLGTFTRIAAVGGMVLMALYYVANPPFIGLDFGIPAEGNYL